MAAGRRLLVALAVVVVAVIAATGVAARAEAASCTAAEARALGVPVEAVHVFDGWYAVAELDAALGRACRAVPSKWRQLERSFTQSTRFVDRLYPGQGHGSWAWRCASSEGGHGAWVPNRKGSGAGGWLQFMSSTFWSVIDGAMVRARSVGVRVPAAARSWYSPLGQAIAGSEMLFDGRRGEWDGATC